MSIKIDCQLLIYIKHCSTEVANYYTDGKFGKLSIDIHAFSTVITE